VQKPVHIDSSCVIARGENGFSELGGRCGSEKGGRSSSELGGSSFSEKVDSPVQNWADVPVQKRWTVQFRTGRMFRFRKCGRFRSAETPRGNDKQILERDCYMYMYACGVSLMAMRGVVHYDAEMATSK
jgi:hypothetical protein